MTPLDRETMTRLLSGTPLDRMAIKSLFGQLIRGELDEVQAAGIVTALKVRGERTDELVGAAEALLEAAVSFPGAPVEAIDLVGTGGDGMNTLNISTLAAITTAAMGVPVAKHGNRSITSISGSFDLLQRLGVGFRADPERSARQLRDVGLCFLLAPDYHVGLKHAGDLRRRLNVRTIFNLLGPLVNPARPRSMLLGVALPELLDPMAESLRELGCRSAAVVHGTGLDEVAVHGPTQVRVLEAGELRTLELSPRDFGVETHSLGELTIDSAEAGHERAVRILAGKGGVAENSAIAVNAALAVWLFRGQGSLSQWSNQALQVLSSGQAGAKLSQLIASGRA
jgi:anthranilate phosphoribosyltransferase